MMPQPMRFPAWTLAVFSIIGMWGCTGTPQGASDAPPSLPEDSTTIVLSKYYSSRNYRNWLGRLSEDKDMAPLRFVQAYGADSTRLHAELMRASAVVLTGGEDIHPARYGQAADTVRCGRIDPERDRVEHLLLDHVMEQGLPCLGVCRGLQVMNVHGDGSLHPHLPDAGFRGHRGGVPGNTRDTVHTVSIISEWAQGEVRFPEGVAGNMISHHHQGIDRLAPGYMAWAMDPGGLIEGIRYRDTVSAPFVVGVQWHPERSEPGQVLSDGLGFALLDAVQSTSRN